MKEREALLFILLEELPSGLSLADPGRVRCILRQAGRLCQANGW